ncbi:MAG: DUF5690 family protein [Pirellulaceae bacterium]|nr:DUF5690 family protein [Pirellulaceae bacterium]
MNSPSIKQRLATAKPTWFSTYCIIAAFGTYFCMYAFRKPFTAGTFEGLFLFGVGYKTVLITSQVFGYTLSKFIGIKYVSELGPSKRALGIVLLIGIAEVALLLFAVVPTPYNFIMLFINGLPLGMVFGLVLRFLEGRRLTEALSAGLCASFIVSSGVVKSVGRVLIQDYGVSEFWMPFLTGMIFVIPLLTFVWMLNQIPPPSEEDVRLRTERVPMNHRMRRNFFRRHAIGLIGLLIVFILLTVMRSIRDDFAVEIWEGLGEGDEPSIYAKSETWVMIGVVVLNGVAIQIKSNRKAFMTALGLIVAGFVLIIGALGFQQSGTLEAFPFMVLIGFGAYVPYVAFHTTVWERLVAAFREKATIGYLMYLADATGYLGYVAIMLFREWFSPEIDFLAFFINVSYGIAILCLLVTFLLVIYYSKTLPGSESLEAGLDSTPTV